MCTRHTCLFQKGGMGAKHREVGLKQGQIPASEALHPVTLSSICSTQCELQRAWAALPLYPFFPQDLESFLWPGSMHCLEFSLADILWTGISTFLGSSIQPWVHSGAVYFSVRGSQQGIWSWFEVCMDSSMTQNGAFCVSETLALDGRCQSLSPNQGGAGHTWLWLQQPCWEVISGQVATYPCRACWSLLVKAVRWFYALVFLCPGAEYLASFCSSLQ